MPHGIPVTHEVTVYYVSGAQVFRGTHGYCKEIRASAILDGTSVSGIRMIQHPSRHALQSRTVEISLPWDLDRGMLQVDPAASWSLSRAIEWFHANVGEEEAPRIFTGAVALYHSLEGKVSFGRCLETAIIWERG